jgi:hypothetical protein
LNYIKTVPNVAIYMSLYDVVKNALVTRVKEHDQLQQLSAKQQAMSKRSTSLACNGIDVKPKRQKTQTRACGGSKPCADETETNVQGADAYARGMRQTDVAAAVNKNCSSLPAATSTNDGLKHQHSTAPATASN